MKYLKSFLILTVFLAFYNNTVFAQNERLNLKNVLIVSQQEDISDRYSMEVALLQLFGYYDIKTKASLNVVKEGGAMTVLATDSLQNKLKEEGFDTYLLISVRGYDSRFHPLQNLNDLKSELEAGHLFPVYRDGASKVTFSFIFYRDGQPVHYDLIRTGNVSSKESAIKKMLEKVEKKLDKEWLK